MSHTSNVHPLRCPSENWSVGLSDQEALELLGIFNPVGFWRIDLETSHAYVSVGNSVLFGKEPSSEPVNVADYCDRIHPDDIDRFLKAIEQAAKEQTSFCVLYRLNVGGAETVVQTIGRYRAKPGTNGEIIGITLPRPRVSELRT